MAASVLVPVLNEGDAIREVVAAMRDQRLPGGSLEFILAHGPSADDTRPQLEDLAREDERIRIVENPAGDTASGLNLCLREARGTYVVRMDAHTIYPREYIFDGVRRLERGDVAWVAGPQVPEGRGPVSRAVTAALQSWIGRGGSRKWSTADVTEENNSNEEYDLDTGVFCGVWRRADLISVGGFDEEWPINQDSELAARFLRRDHRIVCLPAMAARYYPRDSLDGLWRQYRRYGLYRAKTALRHPTSLRRSAILPPVVAIDLAMALVAPGKLRRLARVGLIPYAGLVAYEAMQLARRGKPVEAGLLPVVLPTIHLAHGVGFIEGASRWGIPWRALLRVSGTYRPENDEQPYRGPVNASGLNGSAPKT
ncbi:MAG TPA: glycosyltransferase [Solirubrobacteraceae bacterium]